MQDEPDPPRKVYGFKPKEFERDNAPRPELPAGDSPPQVDPGPTADAGGRIDVRDLIRSGAGDGPQLGSNKVANRSNEIHDILRDNLARADAAGLNEVKTPKRWSRRRRDYIITMCLGNGVLIVGTFIMPVFGVAGLIMFNLGYTWVTWFIMEDY